MLIATVWKTPLGKDGSNTVAVQCLAQAVSGSMG